MQEAKGEEAGKGVENSKPDPDSQTKPAAERPDGPVLDKPTMLDTGDKEIDAQLLPVSQAAVVVENQRAATAVEAAGTDAAAEKKLPEKPLPASEAAENPSEASGNPKLEDVALPEPEVVLPASEAAAKGGEPEPVLPALEAAGAVAGSEKAGKGDEPEPVLPASEAAAAGGKNPGKGDEDGPEVGPVVTEAATGDDLDLAKGEEGKPASEGATPKPKAIRGAGGKRGVAAGKKRAAERAAAGKEGDKGGGEAIEIPGKAAVRKDRQFSETVLKETLPMSEPGLVSFRFCVA